METEELSADELGEADLARSFWTWFVEAEPEFRGLEWIEEIYTELSSRWPRIGVELAAPEEASRREIVLTAFGDRSLFPAVMALKKLAPYLSAWKVVAFQQPKGFGSTHRREGLVFETCDMWFCPTGPGGDPSRGLGVLVFAEFEPEDKKIALSAVWSILESALGELCVAEEIHNVDVAPYPDDLHEQLPLHDLPDYLAWHRKRERSD